MSNYYCLNHMEPDQTAQIRSLTASGTTRRRLLDLGLVEGTLILCVGKSPSGDPAAFLIRGAVIAIRATDGEQVLITRPKSHQRLICLAGNPNVGKSTVFNELTGLRQHTGNWPGKTVACAKGEFIRNGKTYTLVDLPGTYSLMAHSAEEEIARDFICEEHPDAVIVVCDATCLERNLNLVLQIRQITDRGILCVNLCDEARRKGIEIDFTLLSDLLRMPVVPCSASVKRESKNWRRRLSGCARRPHSYR